MPEHPDILDQKDPLRGPFIASVLVHGSVVALLFVSWLWINRSRDTLGEIHPSGGPAYAVSPVHSIPIPRREAPPNPVANDSQSPVPVAPAKQEIQKQQPPPPKNAFEIPEKKKKQAPRPQPLQHYTPPAPPNQVYSRSPQAVSSPMYNQQSGAGQVGIGPNSLLGNRLGYYAELVRERIAQNWQTNGLDARGQRTPVIVSFYIMRDGSIKSPEVTQPSGNPMVDNSALRAVYAASPLPPLPPQIAENSISAQFTFNLR
ncbi:MAG: TonB family protein [Acidobacteriaceae bacterium]|nr:TonB family protein [Acidobacteriaceae bacterium]MBV9500546.1 TonB family protein [Acidobacteriaceae bacterium]